MKIHWRGIFPALSTPCDDTGAVDEESLRNQVRWNMAKGAHGVIVSIMAGEFHKFSDAERTRCYEIVVEEVSGKIPVLVGTSHSGTEVSIYLAQYAKKVGADGIVVLPPYFNLPDGTARFSLYDHYRSIATRVDIPIMIQDCEGVGPYMCVSLFKRLAKDCSNIVAVKLEGPTSFEKALEMRETAPDVVLFGGMAAANMFEELKIGVAGNVPDACMTDLLVEVYDNFVAENLEAAESLFKRYKNWVDFLQLHIMSNCEVEKETLRLRRVIKSSYTRLPRGPMLSEAQKHELNQILQNMQLN